MTKKLSMVNGENFICKWRLLHSKFSPLRLAEANQGQTNLSLFQFEIGKRM